MASASRGMVAPIWLTVHDLLWSQEIKLRLTAVKMAPMKE